MKSTQGFTLIELLIVIAIIGILAAVLIPNLLNARKAGHDSATQSYARQAATNAELVLTDPTKTIADVAKDCSALPGASALPAQSVKSCALTASASGDGYVVNAESTTGSTVVIDDKGFAFKKGW